MGHRTLTKRGVDWILRDYPLLKAPTLGSNQTLVCPYALLAHYHESPSFFEHHRIPRHLVRLAVSCNEDLDPNFAALDQGLIQIL